MAQRTLSDAEMAAFEEHWKAGKTPADFFKDRDTATLAALGVPTEVGDLRLLFSPVTIARLGVVDSPMLKAGDGDQSLTEQDVANALYALAGGDAAVAPLYGMRQRRAALDARMSQAKELGPEFYRVWLEKDLALSGAWAEFEKTAAAYYAAHCGGMDLQDVCDALVTGLRDAFDWADGLADDPTKKAGAPTAAHGTPNGSAAPSGRWWGSAFRWLRRCMGRSPDPAGLPSASKRAAGGT